MTITTGTGLWGTPAPWVVRRLDQGGGYLAPPGAVRAFVTKPNARRFPSMAAALAECCGNEAPERTDG